MPELHAQVHRAPAYASGHVTLSGQFPARSALAPWGGGASGPSAGGASCGSIPAGSVSPAPPPYRAASPGTSIPWQVHKDSSMTAAVVSTGSPSPALSAVPPAMPAANTFVERRLHGSLRLSGVCVGGGTDCSGQPLGSARLRGPNIVLCRSASPAPPLTMLQRGNGHSPVRSPQAPLPRVAPPQPSVRCNSGDPAVLLGTMAYAAAARAMASITPTRIRAESPPMLSVVSSDPACCPSKVAQSPRLSPQSALPSTESACSLVSPDSPCGQLPQGVTKPAAEDVPEWRSGRAGGVERRRSGERPCVGESEQELGRTPSFNSLCMSRSVRSSCNGVEDASAEAVCSYKVGSWLFRQPDSPRGSSDGRLESDSIRKERIDTEVVVVTCAELEPAQAPPVASLASPSVTFSAPMGDEPTSFRGATFSVASTPRGGTSSTTPVRTRSQPTTVLQPPRSDVVSMAQSPSSPQFPTMDFSGPAPSGDSGGGGGRHAPVSELLPKRRQGSKNAVAPHSGSPERPTSSAPCSVRGRSHNDRDRCVRRSPSRDERRASPSPGSRRNVGSETGPTLPPKESVVHRIDQKKPRSPRGSIRRPGASVSKVAPDRGAEEAGEVSTAPSTSQGYEETIGQAVELRVAFDREVELCQKATTKSANHASRLSESESQAKALTTELQEIRNHRDALRRQLKDKTTKVDELEKKLRAEQESKLQLDAQIAKADIACGDLEVKVKAEQQKRSAAEELVAELQQRLVEFELQVANARSVAVGTSGAEVQVGRKASDIGGSPRSAEAALANGGPQGKEAPPGAGNLLESQLEQLRKQLEDTVRVVQSRRETSDDGGCTATPRASIALSVESGAARGDGGAGDKTSMPRGSVADCDVACTPFPRGSSSAEAGLGVGVPQGGAQSPANLSLLETTSPGSSLDVVGIAAASSDVWEEMELPTEELLVSEWDRLSSEAGLPAAGSDRDSLRRNSSARSVGGISAGSSSGQGVTGSNARGAAPSAAGAVAGSSVKEPVGGEGGCDVPSTPVADEFTPLSTRRGGVSLRDLSEIKTLKKPPPPVRMVMEICCLLFNIAPVKQLDERGGKKWCYDYWEPARRYLLSDPFFPSKLRQIDVETISSASRAKIKRYFKDPEFAAERVRSCSKAAFELYNWVRALVEQELTTSAGGQAEDGTRGPADRRQNSVPTPPTPPCG